VASLDPLARREFLKSLMEFNRRVRRERHPLLASGGRLERACDYLIVLVNSRVLIAGRRGGVAHHPHAADRRTARPRLAAVGCGVIEESHTDRQSTLIVRSAEPVDDAAWTSEPLDLEDLVLAYMANTK